jgi:single-strand DNA-binding protein
MSGVNKVVLIGNLGRDCELRYTDGGSAVATFNVACTETWKDKTGQKQERTEWLRCVLWGKAAESVSEYLVKGKQVYVEGKLQTRKYEGRDGVEKTVVEIRVDRVQLLGGGGPRREDRPNREEADPDSASGPAGGGFDDEE